MRLCGSYARIWSVMRDAEELCVSFVIYACLRGFMRIFGNLCGIWMYDAHAFLVDTYDDSESTVKPNKKAGIPL
jgi:hypothetical protein